MTMDTDLTHLLYFIVYQVFPYVVITVWLVGSFIRFLTHPYTVKSQSSELLGGKKEINWGARFFHVGVIPLCRRCCRRGSARRSNPEAPSR